MRLIRLVTFDALHTLITPRVPIHIHYSNVFSPYIGELPPKKVKESFMLALKAVQEESPSYASGTESFWRDVIRRTAIGAGGNEEALDPHLNAIVKKLMTHYHSKQAYRAFGDAIPIINRIQKLHIKTAIISNGDSRTRNILRKLKFPKFLHPIVLSAEEGIEKPSPEIFARTLEIVNQGLENGHDPIEPSECLHIGDDLIRDYNGAHEAKWHALLLRRRGPDGQYAEKEPGEVVEQAGVIRSLAEILKWLENYQT